MEEQFLLPTKAKKYPDDPAPRKSILSLKLDGNLCVAFFNDVTKEWMFLKSGGGEQTMKFDMTGFDKECVYFGEIMSDEAFAQAEQIIKLYKGELAEKDMDRSLIKVEKDLLYITGRANRKDGDTSGMQLVLFDCKFTQSDKQNMTSLERKDALDKYQGKTSKNVKILGMLEVIDLDEMEKRKIDPDKYIKKRTHDVVGWGGEGIIINNHDAVFYHSKNKSDRTVDVLKSKKFGVMELRVEGFRWGASVNKKIRKDLIKDFKCGLVNDKGERISVNAWNGIVKYVKREIELKEKFPELAKLDSYVTREFPELTSKVKNLNMYLKEKFSKYPKKILNKILQIKYFEKTQNKNTKGTDEWSLQQAVIEMVREDKDYTSDY